MKIGAKILETVRTFIPKVCLSVQGNKTVPFRKINVMGLHIFLKTHFSKGVLICV